MDTKRFQELLARAKASAIAAKEQEAVDAATALESSITTSQVSEVDTSLLGITNETLKTDVGQDMAVDIIRDVVESLRDKQLQTTLLPNLETAESFTEDSDAERKPFQYGVAKVVTLNKLQQAFHDAVLAGDDVICVGAAGTGKTTSCNKITTSLISSDNPNRIKPLRESTKWLQAGVPGIIIVSYTRKAVNNIRHAVVEELKCHTLTLHKVLEFAPVFYEIEDTNNPGMFKKTMRFEPKRNHNNPLPSDLLLALFEESSMIAGVMPHEAHHGELYNLWKEAMPHKHQEVLLGDIQQLPPIFGLAILGFKMLELPVIELTEVYRQALESPIISLAWKILEGNPHDFSSKTEKVVFDNHGKSVTRIRVPALDGFTKDCEAGSVKFQPWQKKLSSDHALITATKQFTAWSDGGYYNPQEDIILCPFNVSFGTIELNKGISQHLGVKRQARVHEVIAGFNKHYLAVGDRVLYDKEDAVIEEIIANTEYLGKHPIPASTSLDRWGHYRETPTDAEILESESVDTSMSEEDVEKLMASAASETEDRVQVASHVVVIRYLYGDGEQVELESASEINNLLGGYALTVHKAQGSEWKRVFFVMHHSYAVMNSRELLYTAVTRASQFLHIICETDTFEKGIKSQRIKGNTLAEKAEFFKGKQPVVDEAKLQEMQQRTAGSFQAGIYKGLKKEDKIAIAVSDTAAPMKLVDLSTLIPASFQERVLANLSTYWNRAKQIWGADNIGSLPNVSYKLQKSNILGTANAGKGLIKLNPVWCLLGIDNDEVRKEMMETTLIHETCHIVGARYGLSKGHDSGWIMSMKLMGAKPEAMYTGDTLPSWLDAWKEVVLKKQEALAGSGFDVKLEGIDEGEEV